jgi:MoxR-like ATPase
MTHREVMAYRDAVEHIPAPANVIDYAARLVRATRPSSDGSAAGVSRWIRWGASPRASQNLILAGRARAACDGRFNVACEDVVAVAPMVLRHRIIRSFHADAEGQSTDDIVKRLLEEVPQDATRVTR